MSGFGKGMPKPKPTNKGPKTEEMSEGQTALWLFRLPQSSQRLDLGALSIGIAAGCGCKMKQMRQETSSTLTEVVLLWCQNLGV